MKAPSKAKQAISEAYDNGFKAGCENGRADMARTKDAEWRTKLDATRVASISKLIESCATMQEACARLVQAAEKQF